MLGQVALAVGDRGHQELVGHGAQHGEHQKGGGELVPPRALPARHSPPQSPAASGHDKPGGKPGVDGQLAPQPAPSAEAACKGEPGMGVIQIGEVVGPDKAGVGHGHVQLFQVVARMGEVEEQQVKFGYLGEIFFELLALTGGGHPVHVVVGVGVLRHILRQAQVGEVLLSLLRGGVLENAVEHGVVVGLVVHPAGEGEVHRPQHRHAGHSAAAQPLPVFRLRPEEEDRTHAQSAQGGHRQVDELAPAVHHAGEEVPPGVPAQSAPARQQPQAKDRHGQQAQHLYRLAVQGVEIGDVPLVAQDKEDGQLCQQVAPQGGQPEGAEQQEQQPGITQQVDEAQHLDVVGVQALAGEHVEGQVSRQGGPDKHQMDGGVGGGVVQVEEQVPQLLTGGVPLKDHAEGVLIHKGAGALGIVQGVGAQHTAEIPVVGQARSAPRKEHQGHDDCRQSGQQEGAESVIEWKSLSLHTSPRWKWR